MLIRAVIFDMDGLMVDTEPLYRTIWQCALGDCGYTMTDEYFARMIGRRGADCKRMLVEDFGSDFPLEQVLQRARAHAERTFSERPVPLKPGLLELLDLLERRQVPRAVATSTDRARATARLESVGLLGRFHTLISGDQVEHGKPAPDIFLAAAKALQVSPEQCLVLEDSEPGIAGAHAAGMIPVMVPDLLRPCDEIRRRCHAVLESLHGVLDLIEMHLGPPARRRYHECHAPGD